MKWLSVNNFYLSNQYRYHVICFIWYLAYYCTHFHTTCICIRSSSQYSQCLTSSYDRSPATAVIYLHITGYRYVTTMSYHAYSTDLVKRQKFGHTGCNFININQFLPVLELRLHMYTCTSYNANYIAPYLIFMTLLMIRI